MELLRRTKVTHLFFIAALLFTLACGGIGTGTPPSQEQPMQITAPSTTSDRQAAEENAAPQPLFNKPLQARVMYQPTAHDELGFTHQPSFAEDGQGNVHLVWNSYTGILHRMVDPGGTWSTEPDVVDSFSDPFGSSYRLLSSPDGGLCVVWSDSGIGELKERCWREGQWQETLVVETNDYSLEKGWNAFSAAIDVDGTLKFFKQADKLDPVTLAVVASLSLNGIRPIESNEPPTRAMGPFGFAIDAAGGYHLVYDWWDEEAGPQNFLVYKYSNDRGKTWQPAIRLNGAEDMGGNDLQLVADRLGNLHLIWSSTSPDSIDANKFGHYAIKYRRWTPVSGWEPTEQALEYDNSWKSSLTVDSKGLPHIFTISELPQGSLEGTYVTRSEGGRWTTSRPVHLVNNHAKYTSAIIVSRDGVIHFAWVDKLNGANVLYYASYPE